MRPKVTWLISDSHWLHDRLHTYFHERPANFTGLLIQHCQEVIQPYDLVIHIGDVIKGDGEQLREIMAQMPGRWVLVEGNHDKNHSLSWWMDHGFMFACEGMKYRDCWISHKPANTLPDGCKLNLHGHLHTYESMLRPHDPKPWHRLVSVEYSNYYPINFDKFLEKPEKFKALFPGVAAQQ